MEAVAHLERESGPLLEYAVIKVASRSMTSQPVRIFPAMVSHGNPAGLAAISDQT
ncbi:MAG: hypothetical protein WBF34_33300 [Streptosporangiaceae bacterium]|jgi:hypothetical protein